MRFSTAFACAAACLSPLAQSHPVNGETSIDLVERTVSDWLAQPAHDLALRSTTELELSERFIEKRASSRWSKGTVSCPGPFKHAPSKGFREAVKEVRKRKGRPSLAARGQYPTCETVCFKEIQISWCNKDNKRKTLESWGSVAEGIDVLLGPSGCTAKENGVEMTGGAIFHPTNWYVFAGTC